MKLVCPVDLACAVASFSPTRPVSCTKRSVSVRTFDSPDLQHREPTFPTNSTFEGKRRRVGVLALLFPDSGKLYRGLDDPVAFARAKLDLVKVFRQVGSGSKCDCVVCEFRREGEVRLQKKPYWRPDPIAKTHSEFQNT